MYFRKKKESEWVSVVSRQEWISMTGEQRDAFMKNLSAERCRVFFARLAQVGKLMLGDQFTGPDGKQYRLSWPDCRDMAAAEDGTFEVIRGEPKVNPKTGQLYQKGLVMGFVLKGFKP